MKNCLLGLLILLLMSGCIFSGGDIEETVIIEPYYISYSGLNHQLIIKEKGANTNKIIIKSNIDSIGHYGKYIFGKVAAEYFIINTETENFEGTYNTYSSFKKAIEDLNLNTEMESTN